MLSNASGAGDPMCNLYSVTTNVEAIARLFQIRHGATMNLPVFEEVYPNREAPVVRLDEEGARELCLMRWGYPPPPGGDRPVTNVRNLASPFWRSSLSSPRSRCLVPVTKFSEWPAEPDPVTRRKRKVWFSMAEEADVPFAFAGIWRRADGPEGPEMRMAFLTTMANSLAASVHPKAMPVILRREDYSRWLVGSTTDAVALAQAYPSEKMLVLN